VLEIDTLAGERKIVTRHFMNYIKYILLILSLKSFAQNDSIKNIIDSNGIKQGYWLEKKLMVSINFYKVVDSSNKISKENVKRYFPVSEGQYLNGQRVGKWIDYPDCLNYFDFNASSVELNEESINTDTTNVDGEIYLAIDTMKINCHNEDCKLITSNGKTLRSFKRKDLENELLNTAQCRYNSLINKKKNSQ
jgi:hypothetical protein